jgi:hypothetical protein
MNRDRFFPESVRGGVTLEHQHLQGLWSYTAYAVGEARKSPEQLATMSKLVLLPGAYLPGWSGIWAAVTYGYEGGSWSEEQVVSSCRERILEAETEAAAPAPDFYLWAGGRFWVAQDRSPKEIDFEQFIRGQVLPSSLQLGIFEVADKRLTLCLAETGNPRPSSFNSGESPYQKLGELIRGKLRAEIDERKGKE